MLISNVSNTVLKTFLWKVEVKFTSKYMKTQKVCFLPKDISLYKPAGMPFALLLPAVYLQIAPSECWGNHFLLEGFISSNFHYPKVRG